MFIYQRVQHHITGVLPAPFSAARAARPWQSRTDAWNQRSLSRSSGHLCSDAPAGEDRQGHCYAWISREREREQHNYMGNRPFIETWEKWLKIQVQEIPEDLSSLKIGNGNSPVIRIHWNWRVLVAQTCLATKNEGSKQGGMDVKNWSTAAWVAPRNWECLG